MSSRTDRALRRPESDLAQAAAPPAARATPPPIATVLDLQRSAGNQSVGRMLAARSPGGVLQRQDATAEQDAAGASGNAATKAVDDWRVQVQRLIAGLTTWQLANWTAYLDSTTGNSTLGLSNSQLADISNNAVGNAITELGTLGLKELAKKSPPALLAGIGTLVDPGLGTLVGFAIGVLVEYAASQAFEAFTRKTDIEEATADATEELGAAFQEKLALFSDAETKTNDSVEFVVAGLKERLADASTPADEVERIRSWAEREATYTPPPPAPDDRGLATSLLQVWVLENAGNLDTAHGTASQVQFDRAIEEAFGAGATLANHPEVFAMQTRAEWERAGLAHSDQSAAMLEAVQLLIATTAIDKRAEVCQDAFHDRVYTFTEATSPERLYHYIRDHSGMEERPEEEYLDSIRAGTTKVTCTLDVHVSEGSAYIDEWNFDVWWDTDKGVAPANHTWFDIWPTRE